LTHSRQAQLLEEHVEEEGWGDAGPAAAGHASGSSRWTWFVEAMERALRGWEAGIREWVNRTDKAKRK
jgi:hypothetical protein